MSKRQKLSGAEYKRRRANREKTETEGTATVYQFLIPVTTEANEILNADAQAAEQPELHIANVNIPILIDPVEATSATSCKIPIEVTEQLQQVEEQAEQQLLHDYLGESGAGCDKFNFLTNCETTN